MYSGFISSKRSVPAVGVHQRMDTAAFRIIAPYLAENTFPNIDQILHFEGINGPDGLKVKSPGKHEPGHLYDPETEIGEIPGLIQSHYHALVDAVKAKDEVRAAFEAAWVAHYVCDGLTPAHHYPLDAKMAEHTMSERKKKSKYKHKVLVDGDTMTDAVKRSWAVWGGKGLLSTHFNFEMGVATTMIGHKIKLKLDHAKLAEARKLGAVGFFKQEARDVASLQMYERFYSKGWDSVLARMVKNRLVPQISQAIAVTWLLAYLEAGMDDAKLTAKSKSKPAK